MPPDILVLMTDQHRADWVGAPGATHVRTPVIDSLAAQGMALSRCYTPSPLCMPARASFITGMYPHSHGMWENAGRIPDPRDSFLHGLRVAGYRTCHVGKSHLYPHGRGSDLREEEPFMRALGWDDILECTGPLSTQTTTSLLTDWMKEQGIYELFLEDYRRRAEVGMNRALWPSPLPDGKHPDVFIAQLAADFIQRSDTGRPLYLFVGFGGPHSPWDPPQRFDRYDPGSMPAPLPRDPAPVWLGGAALEHHQEMMSLNPDISADQWLRVRSLYSARVEHVDSLMGRGLEAWTARRGTGTWIIFWSDHGEMAGDKGRCSKSVFYEGSVRVPAIIRPPGGACPPAFSGLTSLLDLTATILDAAGCGRDLPNVFGRSLASDPQGWEGRRAVFSEVGERTMAFDGRFKLVCDSHGRTLKLFDLQEDAAESLNLAGHPAYVRTEERLRGQMLAFLLGTAHRQWREING